MTSKFHLVTFGCQMNKHDSERIAGLLARHGLRRASAIDDAQVIVYNTCCVRDRAEERFYGQLTQLAPKKKANPSLILAVTGCVAEKDGNEVFRRAPHVDLVVGTAATSSIGALVMECLNGRSGRACVLDAADTVCSDLPAVRESPVHGWISIMTGCDNFCSYCIVPHVRGRERSRSTESIVAEAEQMAAEGVLEATLLGQNVNSYGRDMYGRPRFAALLKQVDRCGIERIRFTTSHPKDLCEGTIEAIAGSDHVCRHIHLPVQSGSSAVLARMNRAYTKEGYLGLVRNIRAAMPDVSLSTDIMVGFPGETEADFEDTLDVVDQAGYDQAFTFIFSKRASTPAADMEDQVPEDVMHERFDRLVRRVTLSAHAASEAYVGRTVEVLVEGPSAKDVQRLTGRTRTNKVVHFSGSPQLRHHLVDVRIGASRTWYLEGELAQNEGGIRDGRSDRVRHTTSADHCRGGRGVQHR